MPRKILVVDDEPGYRDMLCMDLTDRGYDVLSAGDGIQAMETLQTHEVDLILTDMRMPRMDGYSMAVEIRKTRPGMPIVLMTGHALEEKVEELIAHGAAACVRKPFDIDHLADTIQKQFST